MNELIKFLDKYNVVYEIEDNLVVADIIVLSGANLTSLPESFGNIKCNWLDLGFNNLTKLPESFGNVKCVNLCLGNNNLTGLPESFSNIKCDSLYLNYNNLTSLPESFGNIKCNKLYLGSNNLTSLPESFGNIKCNKLYLDNSKLTSLPKSFGDIKCDRLYLSSNDLTSLPESFGNVKCSWLDLSNNNLTSLPESLGNIKCNYFYLNNNNLTSLPESFSNVKCNWLNLSNNNFTEFPEVRKFDEVEITDEYVYCDKILTWFDKIKKINEYIVYVGCFGNFVVTKDNEVFAHSKSIRQGVSDLLFKLSDRDVEKYKSIDLNEQIPIEQAIVMYRTITGACSYGVENFMKGKKFSETISVNEIMDIIGNQYGSIKFKEFF
jgi:hypothetical protein